MNQHTLIYLIAALATAGVIIRPFKVPEYVWALCGAALLLIIGLISWPQALAGARKGTDVYLFLAGMMLLSEAARESGLFDWLACYAVRAARGSALKLFGLTYLVGIVVTTFMSNDATAVVLTPAVAAAVKSARVKQPLPFLFICAFIANAASFMLPISNPANLVIYGNAMPPLADWLRLFLLPSVCAIGVTYLVLYITQRQALKETIATDITLPRLTTDGKVALAGIFVTTLVLLFASVKHQDLGMPAAIAGALTAGVVAIVGHTKLLQLVKQVSWSVLLLVAGLFIIVEALGTTGLVRQLGTFLNDYAQREPGSATWWTGTVTAVSCNLINNLPAGLIAGSVAAGEHLPGMVRSAILIGIDLGPNLSVTGSLATLLWINELRRQGQSVTAWQFLKLGVWVMVPALIAALFALWL